MYAALLAGQLGAMQWIHAKSKTQIQQITADSWNLTHLAAFIGRTDILSWLIHGLQLLNKDAVTNEQWSTAYAAAMGGQIDTLSILKNQPQWNEMIAICAKDRSTPLHAAAYRNHRQTVE